MLVVVVVVVEQRHPEDIEQTSADLIGFQFAEEVGRFRLLAGSALGQQEDEWKRIVCRTRARVLTST